MNAQATAQAQATATARTGFRFRRRHAWWIPGLAIAVLGSQLSERNALGIVPLIVFQMSPHLPALFGPRAVPLFNVAHHPLPSLVLIGVALLAALPPIWLVAGLGWLSHVVIGWGIGDRMRHRDGARA